MHRDSPPEYEGLYPREQQEEERPLHGEMHPFEMEGPASPNVGLGGRFKNTFIRPVSHFVINPVALFLNRLNQAIDAKLSLFINPLFARRLIVIFLCVFVLVLFSLFYDNGQPDFDRSSIDNMETLRLFLGNAIDTESMRSNAEYLAKMPHFAGSAADDTTATFVEQLFRSYGYKFVHKDEHPIFITHGGNATLSSLDGAGALVETTVLTEGISLDNPSDSQKQSSVQMSLATPGEATGHLIYANKGALEDIDFLMNNGIPVKGAVVLVRYSGLEPAMVAMSLEQLGAVGVVFFSSKHPQHAPWPEGMDYAEDAVQRAPLAVPEIVPGDISTPGWTSSRKLRADYKKARNLVHIPVVPASWKDLAPYFSSLENNGVRVPDDWKNNGYPHTNGHWYTGSESGPKVNVKVETQVEENHSIQNVMSILKSFEAGHELVIVGASMDAQCYGGVGLSGLTVLLEVARAFASLRFNTGWEPRRTVVFVAWDGNQQNMAGLSEWMEFSNLHNILNYIDLDVVYGQELSVRGHPMINIEDLSKRVLSRNSTLHRPLMPMKPLVGANAASLFMSHLGVPSVRLGMHGDVYPKDSCFDTLDWQLKFGDTDFSAHKSLADLAAYTILRYADEPVIPFDVSEFAHQMMVYIDEINRYAVQFLPEKAVQEGSEVLHEAANMLQHIGDDVERWRSAWSSFVGPKTIDNENAKVQILRYVWNNQIRALNTYFNDINGLNKRNWYKNLLFGPQYARPEENEYSNTFPGLRDAARIGDTRGYLKAAMAVLEHAQSAASKFP